MLNHRVISVIKRELKEKLLSKSFIIMTALVPVLMFGVIGFQVFLQMYNSDDAMTLIIASNSEELNTQVKNELSAEDFIKSGHYKIDYAVVEKENFSKYLDSIKKNLFSEKINGLIYIPDSSFKNKDLQYYSKISKNQEVFNKLNKPINNALINIYFKGKSLTEDEIGYIRSSVEFSSFRISSDQIEKEGYGNQIISFLLSFLLYLSLIILGQTMLRNVVQEKSNKVAEVLLSSLSAKELMSGKIAGTTVTGVIQMIIWLLPVIFTASTSWFMLPQELLFSISLYKILFFIITYSLGLVTYLGLFAAAGAIVDNDQDAQSMIWPVMILIMIPFFISISLQSNPGSIIGRVSSLVPFASLIVMPARIALVDVPVYEILLSVFINILTLIFVVIISGKIYRLGIIATGKKPSPKELLNWIKTSK
ncbi:MAG: ABC transporter permease [Ignavibacteria bacterium]|nr:ABC transporter permease [Ignavibacteria bacterium]